MVKTIKSFNTIRQAFRRGDRAKIRHIDNGHFKVIIKTLSDILNQRVHVKPGLIRRMSKYKKVFRHLADPRIHNIEIKKRYICNQKGGIFPIFAALIPLIGGLAAKAAAVAVPAALAAKAALISAAPSIAGGVLTGAASYGTTKAIEAIQNAAAKK